MQGIWVGCVVSIFPMQVPMSLSTAKAPDAINTITRGVELNSEVGLEQNNLFL